MSIQLFIVLTYVIALFSVSFYVKNRASSNSTDYLFASRKLSASLVAANITGLAVGAAATVGVAENAFSNGMGAGWYTGAWAVGALAMGLLAAGKYRQLNCTTIPELFERYYDTKGRVVSVIGLITIQLVITSLQYLAGGAILASLLPDIFTFKTGMLASATVFISITFIGGLWSSGISNLVSVVLIYLGITYSSFSALANFGGLEKVMASLPNNIAWFSPLGGLGLATIISWMVVFVTQSLTAQGPVQIACGAKDSATARKGFILGAVLIFPVGFLCALLGIISRVTYPDITATMALPKIIMSLNPVASGITLAALWAADVSTACTILLGAGTLFSQDIYKRFFNPNISEKNYLLVNKLSILFLGLVTLWFAFNAVGILKTMLVGLSLATAFTVVFLFTVFAPSLCRKNSAFVTTVVGILTLVVWEFLPSFRIFSHPIYMEWTACLIAFFLTAVLDKQPIKILSTENAQRSAVYVREESFN